MAPLPVISNVYRVSLLWRAGTGATAANVIHFRGTPGSAAGLYTALDANVTAAMWIQVAASATVEEVGITPLDGTTATLINNPGGVAKWSGSTSGDYIPAASSLLSLRTAKRGVSYRGRVYLPFLPESEQTNGFTGNTDRATAQAAWVTFRTAVAAAGYTMVVASYKLATADNVVAAVFDSGVATQRRRQQRISS